MTKTKKLIALLFVVAMLFTFVSVIAACKPQDECEKNGHKLTAVAQKDATLQEAGYEAYWKCDVCGKLFSDKDGKNEISKPVEIPKLTPQPETHTCKHVCPTCGKCTDATCQDPVCADKCPGHGTPKQPLASGNYNIVLRDETNNLVWYVTGAIGSKGGLIVSHSDATVAVLTVIYENDKYTLKIGSQYLEAYLNGTYKNMRLVNTPSNDAIEWKWSTEYDTFCATYSDETRYLGGNYYNGQVDNLYDGAVTLATAYYFQNNPVVIHYEKVEAATVESVELDRAGEVPMLPITGNTISLVASVKPNNAPQDVEWTSSDQEVATVESGIVTFAGKKGTTIITATAKGTDKKVSVTINTNIKGDTIENALTVDEAIDLMDRVYNSMAAVMDNVSDTFTYGGGDNYNFYIKGTVMEGSKTRLSGTAWELNLAGSNNKKLWVGSVSTISSITKNENGWLDGCEVVVYAPLNKQSSAYVAQTPCEMKSCEFPALTDIVITEAEEGVELKAKYTVQLHATPVPANAPFEGLEWDSSDDTKATVDENGLVTGVAAGDVKITAKVGEVTSSNPCTITVTEQKVDSGIAEYIWIDTAKMDNKLLSSLYIKPVSGDIISTINQWSPDQTEITAFTVTGLMSVITPAAGMGLGYSSATADASIAITTQHQIKKITFKIVPYSTATTVQFAVNGVQFKKDKGDDTWNGKLDCAFDAEIQLETESSDLSFNITNLGNFDNFAIVGIKLEYQAENSVILNWIDTAKMDNKLLSSLYQKPVSGDIISTINQWSPDQTEITAFTVTGLKSVITPAAGMGLGYSSATEGASIAITTQHQIKKITFKIVPYSTATTVQFAVNGVQFKKDKGDDTWNGKLDCAFDAEIQLETESSDLSFNITNLGNFDNFAIVGMTLVY